MPLLLVSGNGFFLIFSGIFGLLLALIFLTVLVYRRIAYLYSIARRKDRKRKRPGVYSTFRNLLAIIFLFLLSTTLLSVGAFFQGYQAFERLKPVAKIIVEPQPMEEVAHVTLVYLDRNDNEEVRRSYRIKGDQWMVEGDIIKWQGWLQMFGLDNRYRLTRIRGRYFITEDELKHKPTVFSLTEAENHLFWKQLYRYGYKLPLVDAVYGNAVYQLADEDQSYHLSIGKSGFVVHAIAGK